MLSWGFGALKCQCKAGSHFAASEPRQELCMPTRRRPGASQRQGFGFSQRVPGTARSPKEAAAALCAQAWEELKEKGCPAAQPACRHHLAGQGEQGESQGCSGSHCQSTYWPCWFCSLQQKTCPDTNLNAFKWLCVMAVQEQARLLLSHPCCGAATSTRRWAKEPEHQRDLPDTPSAVCDH